MRNVLVVVPFLFITGCASISGNKLQPVSVQTIQDNKEVAGAGCTLTNDAGKWYVTTPGSVTIQKSTGDLAVDCNKDGSSVGHENVVSKANGAVWGNILLGGGVGYIVDRNTGAGFDYPTVITVMLNRIGAAIGVQGATEDSQRPAGASADTTPVSTVPLEQVVSKSDKK